MVYGTLCRIAYNLTLCPLQIRFQHIYHGQHYARVDFILQWGTLDLASVLAAGGEEWGGAGWGLEPILSKRRNRHLYFVYKSCAIARSDEKSVIYLPCFVQSYKRCKKFKKIGMEKRKTFFCRNTILKLHDFYFVFFCTSKKTPAISLTEKKSLSLIIFHFKNAINFKRRTCLHQLVLVLLQDRSGLILKALIIKHNFYEVLEFLSSKHLCQCSQIATMHA